MGDKKTGGIFSIWKSVFEFTLSEPRILLPFFFLAACETIILWVLSCSSHFPLSFVLAPPIRRIWGPVYLHYPYIYELLPRIFYFATILSNIFVGSITTGMAIHMVLLSDKNEKIDVKETFFFVLKRYVSLLILVAVFFLGVHFIMKQSPVLLLKYFRTGHPKLLFLGPVFWFNIFIPFASFLLAVVLQSLFVYSLPYIVIKGKKFVAALFSGIRLFFKLWAKTLAVVAVPMLLYIPITLMRNNIGILADTFMPEVTVVVLFLGILAGTAVDILVTIVTTLLFIEGTEHEA